MGAKVWNMECNSVARGRKEYQSISLKYLFKRMNKSKVSKNEPLLKTLFGKVVGKDSSV